jgi:dihydropteroate synthase
MFQFTSKESAIMPSKPSIMAIMNLTPDSFYAKSRMENIQAIVEKAGQFIEEGAGIIDIGGQSTRPGATMITIEEEIERIIPAIQAISKAFPAITISIDTFQSKVAEAAILAGATLVNDISCGSFDPLMIDQVAKHGVGYIGMHITGSKETMHQIPQRENIIEDIIQFFKQKKLDLAAKGVANWIIDPGFGFGKTIDENFTIIKDLSLLQNIGLPILVGVSRKSSIYKTLAISAEDALNGTTVLHTIAIQNGAKILRVHDVKEAKQVITLMEKIQ